MSTVGLEAEKDAYFRRDLAIWQNDNYGRQQFVTVGTGREPPGDPDAMRAAVQFNLDKVPAAQLQTAILALTVHNLDNGAASSTFRVPAHRIIDGPLAIWNGGNGYEGSAIPPGAADPDAAYGVAWLGAGDNPDPLALNNETQPGFDPPAVASRSVNQGAAREAQAARVAGPRLLIRYKDGDINGDGAVDSNDVQAIMAALNQRAGPHDPRDLNGDARITVQDARKLTALCTRPRCALL